MVAMLGVAAPKLATSSLLKQKSHSAPFVRRGSRVVATSKQDNIFIFLCG